MSLAVALRAEDEVALWLAFLADGALPLVVFVRFFLCAGLAVPGTIRITPKFATLQVTTFGACFAEQKLSSALTHHAGILVVAVSPMVRKV